MNGYLKFVIPGQPIPVKRLADCSRREYNEQKQDRIKFSIYVSNIMDNRPLYTGPLHIDCYYYFPVPPNTPAMRNKIRGKPYYFPPKLSKLNEFIEECIVGIVIEAKENISSIVGQKLYDFTPRTEFIVTEMLNDEEYKD